jgi:hypothetical protein
MKISRGMRNVGLRSDERKNTAVSNCKPRLQRRNVGNASFRVPEFNVYGLMTLS